MSANKIALHSANPVVQTLLIPLYARALESRQSEPMIKDELAAALVERLDYDFERLRMAGHDLVASVMRVREFDRYVRDFLARHARATVVQIGCGLDTRFERVCGAEAGHDRVAWFDLDLPDVIAVRRQLLPENEGRRDIACSVFEAAWLDAVRDACSCPTLFLAEGVFPYFEAAQVRGLFLTLAAHFPGADLVCDGMSPFMVRMNNLQLRYMGAGARLHWGLKDGREPEGWGASIRMLDEWHYFDRPEPRLGAMQWLRVFEAMAKGTGIYHYRLGEAAPQETGPEGLP